MAVVIVWAMFAVRAQASVFIPGTVEANYTDPDFKLDEIENLTLEIKGTIAYPIASQVAEALNFLPNGKTVTLVLNSPGGLNEEGFALIKVIDENRSRLTINTLVDNGSQCSSMCIPIFVQGEKRTAAQAAVFLFHGSARSAFTNEIDLPATEEYLNSLRARGVEEQFIQALKKEGVFIEPTDAWLNGAQLLEMNSGVATEVVSSLVKHKPWKSSFNPDAGGPRRYHPPPP